MPLANMNLGVTSYWLPKFGARFSCEKFQSINDFSPGVWSGWGLWGSCDVSCGGGEILRYRVCFGTGECAGDEKDAKECETESCPGRSY